MPKLDLFTGKRMIRFVEDFRVRSGQLPSLKDFDEAGFSEDQVKLGIKTELIEMFYVTLSNGTIVKAFKVKK